MAITQFDSGSQYIFQGLSDAGQGIAGGIKEQSLRTDREKADKLKLLMQQKQLGAAEKAAAKAAATKQKTEDNRQKMGLAAGAADTGTYDPAIHGGISPEADKTFQAQSDLKVAERNRKQEQETIDHRNAQEDHKRKLERDTRDRQANELRVRGDVTTDLLSSHSVDAWGEKVDYYITSGIAEQIGITPDELKTYTPTVGKFLDNKSIPTPMQPHLINAIRAHTANNPTTNIDEALADPKVQADALAASKAAQESRANKLPFITEQLRENYKVKSAAVAEDGKLARAQLGLYKDVKRILDLGVKTGKFSEARIFIGGLLDEAGLKAANPDLVNHAEYLQSLKAAMSKITLLDTQKLKGAMSNKELTFIQQGNQNISSITEANEYIGDTARLRLDRAVEKENFYDKVLRDANTDPSIDVTRTEQMWLDKLAAEEAAGFSGVVPNPQGDGYVFYHNFKDDAIYNWAHPKEEGVAPFTFDPSDPTHEQLIRDKWIEMTDRGRAFIPGGPK